MDSSSKRDCPLAARACRRRCPWACLGEPSTHRAAKDQPTRTTCAWLYLGPPEHLALPEQNLVPSQGLGAFGKQRAVGTNSCSESVLHHVLSFISALHSKSYSTIFHVSCTQVLGCNAASSFLHVECFSDASPAHCTWCSNETHVVTQTLMTSCLA